MRGGGINLGSLRNLSLLEEYLEYSYNRCIAITKAPNVSAPAKEKGKVESETRKARSKPPPSKSSKKVAPLRAPEGAVVIGKRASSVAEALVFEDDNSKEGWTTFPCRGYLGE